MTRVVGGLRGWARRPGLRQAAQDVVEYGLLLAAIVVIVLVAINAFGHLIEPWFANLAGRVTTTGT
jgi:Flp pilus assembly pilin Flp